MDAEDIYKGKENLTIEVVEKRDNGFSILNISIAKKQLGKGYLNKRTLLSVSSCGICGKQKLEDINYSGSKLTNKLAFDTTKLKAMYDEMKQKPETFKISGGSHDDAIFKKDNESISLKEDIGTVHYTNISLPTI